MPVAVVDYTHVGVLIAFIHTFSYRHPRPITKHVMPQKAFGVIG